MWVGWKQSTHFTLIYVILGLSGKQTGLLSAETKK